MGQECSCPCARPICITTDSLSCVPTFIYVLINSIRLVFCIRIHNKIFTVFLLQPQATCDFISKQMYDMFYFIFRAVLRKYLLEKSRIVAQGDSERYAYTLYVTVFNSLDV